MCCVDRLNTQPKVVIRLTSAINSVSLRASGDRRDRVIHNMLPSVFYGVRGTFFTKLIWSSLTNIQLLYFHWCLTTYKPISAFNTLSAREVIRFSFSSHCSAMKAPTIKPCTVANTTSACPAFFWLKRQA